MTVGHRKLTSLNPDKFKKITKYEALSGYKRYLNYEFSAYGNITNAKPFREWLRTEI